MESLVRFDWAMKRLLRDKSNFVVLEGFLSTLLGEKMHICRFLESESNQEDATDKFNRADILAEDTKGRLIIIEVQNNHELSYFHRMLYGVSKTVSEYINLGDAYDKVRKVYSINIVYFELGQGNDYVYHGKTEFKGIHNNDILMLSPRQQKVFQGKYAGDVFPEYYVLKVNDFNEVAKTPLDEWMKFLKTGEIDAGATAEGLPEARERLRVDSMSETEKRAYRRDMEALRYQQSVIMTGWDSGHQEGLKEGLQEGLKKGLQEGLKKGHEEGLKKGHEEGLKEGYTKGEMQGLEKGRMEANLAAARKMKEMGMPVDAIAKCTGIPVEEIDRL